MINFNVEDKGTWFYFDEANHEAGGVCFKELDSDQVAQIERLTTKKKKVVKHGVAYDDVTTNDKLASRLRWRACIVDWKGVSIDNAEAECNNDNKAKIMKIPDFVKFAADCLVSLSESNKSLDEARAKNLKTSADGN